MGIDEDKGKTDGCAAVHVDRYLCNVVRKLDLGVYTDQAIIEEIVDLQVLHNIGQYICGNLDAQRI